MCSDLWVGQRPRPWHCPEAARIGPTCGLQRALQMEAVGAPLGQMFLRVLGSTHTQQTPGAEPVLSTRTCPAFCSTPADAFDNDLMHRTLKNIVEGKTVEVPIYDFVTHSR